MRGRQSLRRPPPGRKSPARPRERRRDCRVLADPWHPTGHAGAGEPLPSSLLLRSAWCDDRRGRTSRGHRRVTGRHQGGMQFRILGPLEVVGPEERPVPLRGRTQRAVLALLLLHANDVVAAERFVDELWSETPPETAPRVLRNAISQLRKVLPADRLETRAPGYLLRVEPEELDAQRFERLGEEGRALLREGRID